MSSRAKGPRQQPQQLQQQHPKGAGPQARHSANPQGGLSSFGHLSPLSIPLLPLNLFVLWSRENVEQLILEPE
jgi:hypothetical protein